MAITRRAFLPVCGAALAGACGERGTAGFTGLAFVANQAGKAIAVVDLTAFAVMRHIPLDAAPAQLVTHADRATVYALSPEAGTVHEIAADQLRVGRQARLGAKAHSLRFAKDASALWGLCAEERLLVRLPLDGFRPDVRVTLPGSPVDMDVALDDSFSAGHAAVSLSGTGQVLLMDLQGGSRRLIKVGGQLGKVRFRKDGRQLLIASLDDNQVIIYDLAADRLSVRLPLAVRPDFFCMNEDGGQLFVTGVGQDALVTVYPYQTEVGGTVLAGRSPGFLAASSGPDYLFIANSKSDDVTIVNIRTQRVMAVAAVGKDPCFIAVTPDNQYALVLNRGSGDMAVLHVWTLGANRTRSASMFTMVPVGSEPVSAVVRKL
ncbi:MAG: hypothetical protein FJW20_23130 [Acidimicrobiia bacterium]|nr:hypothetical protein [Acidimicrobiia bacterium]